MTFKLPYICKSGRNRFIHLPDFYFGFVSPEDANQLHHGLVQNTATEPRLEAVRQSVINLAKKRKEGTK